MGKVTEYLLKTIEEQINKHKLVVWYDPAQHYSELADELNLPEVTMARYKGSFIGLRYEIDALLEDNDPPRVLIYVPMAKEATYNALVELETAGIILKPGQQPPECNTRLSYIAANALRARLGAARAADIEKQVEAGQLNLTELDHLAEQEEVITSGVLSVIYQSVNANQIALTFLDSTQRDETITGRNAQGELLGLLRQAFEIELPAEKSLAAWRSQLARYILLTEFISGLQEPLPEALQAVKIAHQPAAVQACCNLAQNWRQRATRRSYSEAASRVESEFSLPALKLKAAQVGKLETFLAIEKLLQTEAETALLAQPTEAILEIARYRQAGFWAEENVNIRPHWDLIIVAGQVLLEAHRVEQALRTAQPSAGALFTAYTQGEQPWCLLDTYYRHMERRFYNFDFEQTARYDNLHKLVNQARQRYTAVTEALAERFVKSYQADHFSLPGKLRQTEIFEKVVKPALQQGKTAYIWVDALRYEMGRELLETLKEDFRLELQAGVATVPTITEIGMAALLPTAHSDATIVPAGKGKLGLKIGTTLIKDRAGRLKFLKEKAGVDVAAVKLEDLLPTPRPKTRETLQAARLAVVTSQEIDELGEAGNLAQSRRRMDETLGDLKRAFRHLTDLGFQTIVFTADHGFLFGEELSDGMKIEPPGGETLDLHRRVWVGRGGSSATNYLRAKLADFGLGGDLEIAVPWNLACFLMPGGGSTPFQHGGFSPQELVIPIATLKSLKSGQSVSSGQGISWELIPSNPKLTTRFFSAQIKGMSLLEQAAPMVRVELRAGRGKETLSVPVSASYGFEEATGDVQMQWSTEANQTLLVNTITLMVTTDPTQPTVTLHLLDAVTNIELCQSIPLEVAIAI